MAEENKTLFIPIKTEQERIKIILQNTILMLSNRIFVDKQGEKHQLINSDLTIKDLDNKGDHTYVLKANNGDDYVIKIILHKISAIGKQSVISNFLKEYGKYRRIIIANDFNNKISDYLARYQTQLFKEGALLTDIISHSIQPKFELLTPKEMEKVKSEYNVTDYTIIKLVRSDPVAKYFALKKGDIIRVIRPSPTSGESVVYRIVT